VRGPLGLRQRQGKGTKDNRDRANKRSSKTDCELDVETLLLEASVRRPQSRRAAKRT
jgi:hypothetical protein